MLRRVSVGLIPSRDITTYGAVFLRLVFISQYLFAAVFAVGSNLSILAIGNPTTPTAKSSVVFGKAGLDLKLVAALLADKHNLVFWVRHKVYPLQS